MADSNMGKRPGSSGFNGTRKKGGRGHGPGGKMMPGRKGERLQGNHEKTDALSGTA